MTGLKVRDVERFLAKPDISAGIILIYGRDTGLVRQAALRLADSFTKGGAFADPVTLQGDEIGNDPARLMLELNTPSLFGGKPLVRLRNAPKSIAAHLKPLLESPPDALLIVESGTLTTRDALRLIIEKAPQARALPCFPDDARTREDLIRDALTGAKISPEPGTIETFAALLGNDREVSLREIEKVLLFAEETKTLSQDEIIELCGDNAALAIDEILDATGRGQAQILSKALERAEAGALDHQSLILAALRHFSALRAMRITFDKGTPAQEIVKKQRPTPHFSRVRGLEEQVRIWNDASLAAACNRIYAAIYEIRRTPRLKASLVQRALLALCMVAASH